MMAAWVKVHIPHTNLRNSLTATSTRRATSLSPAYRKTFTSGFKALQGKRILADFGAVMAYAEVYLNGQTGGQPQGRLHAFQR
jgi:beta-galactosidase/beta-glucuronidase